MKMQFKNTHNPILPLEHHISDSEGVAVSDSPIGPFKNPIQLPCGGIDSAIFIDDDGSAYLYWGQLFSHGIKLNPDMISFDGEQIVDTLVTEEDHYFHEGSSMRKIGDTYYYVYANIEHGKPTSLGYSTSKSPLGSFTYQDIFYHRSSKGREQYRRLCIEPITILPDGTIPEVKMTSQGPFTFPLSDTAAPTA